VEATHSLDSQQCAKWTACVVRYPFLWQPRLRISLIQQSYQARQVTEHNSAPSRTSLCLSLVLRYGFAFHITKEELMNHAALFFGASRIHQRKSNTDRNDFILRGIHSLHISPRNRSTPPLSLRPISLPFLDFSNSLIRYPRRIACRDKSTEKTRETRNRPKFVSCV